MHISKQSLGIIVIFGCWLATFSLSRMSFHSFSWLASAWRLKVEVLPLLRANSWLQTSHVAPVPPKSPPPFFLNNFYTGDGLLVLLTRLFGLLKPPEREPKVNENDFEVEGFDRSLLVTDFGILNFCNKESGEHGISIDLQLAIWNWNFFNGKFIKYLTQPFPILFQLHFPILSLIATQY